MFHFLVRGHIFFFKLSLNFVSNLKNSRYPANYLLHVLVARATMALLILFPPLAYAYASAYAYAYPFWLVVIRIKPFLLMAASTVEIIEISGAFTEVTQLNVNNHSHYTSTIMIVLDSTVAVSLS